MSKFIKLKWRDVVMMAAASLVSVGLTASILAGNWRAKVDEFVNVGEKYRYYLDGSGGGLSFVNIETGTVMSFSDGNEASIVSPNGCLLKADVRDGRFQGLSILNRNKEGVLVSASDDNGDVKWTLDSSPE